MLIMFQAIHLNLTNRKITPKMRDFQSLLNGILMIMEPQDQETTNNLLTGASTSTPKRQIRGIYLLNLEKLLSRSKIPLLIRHPHTFRKALKLWVTCRSIDPKVPS